MKKQEAGFTLLEVMVALLIFGLVLGGMAPVFGSLLNRNTEMEVRSGAVAAAQQQLDVLRLEDPRSMPTSGTQGPIPIVVDERTFEVSTTYCSDSSFCASGNSRHLVVSVVYRGEPRFEIATVFTQLR